MAVAGATSGSPFVSDGSPNSSADSTVGAAPSTGATSQYWYFESAGFRSVFRPETQQLECLNAQTVGDDGDVLQAHVSFATLHAAVVAPEALQ